MSQGCTVEIKKCGDLKSEAFDSVVLIIEETKNLPSELAVIAGSVHSFAQIHKTASDVHSLYCDEIPSKRLILSFTNTLDRDYDDSRRIIEAATKGIEHAIDMGSAKPLLVLGPLKSAEKLKHTWLQPNAVCLMSLIGALHALYVPIEVREFNSKIPTPKKLVHSKSADLLGWFAAPYYAVDHEKLIHLAWCLEEGRRVSRDIGGSDPQRMSSKNIVKYLEYEIVSPVQMKVSPVDEKLYPTAAIVDRGNNEYHRGQIVHLSYDGSSGSEVDDSSFLNLFLVGKGVTYDTGGSDLKVGGIMASMHRDKCGAAAVAGFFKVLSLIKPKHLKVHGSLALVRNSIGENAYVSDEIVTTRAGVRIRVTNTDAEGRMVMTDLLCEAKEQALTVQNPRLLTIATLTGHAVQTFGPGYTGVLCNGPAKQLNEDHNFQSAGALIGEMFEISTIRREDYEAHKAKEVYADLRNSARPANGKRVRGHQSPPAFMIVASGLDSHSSNSDHPLPYTHLDIAASEGSFPGIPTGVPILTLASRYLLPKEIDWPCF